MEYIFYGIDFGTTNTSVCMYSADDDTQMSKPIISFGENENTVPFSSCIAISKSNASDILCGRRVKEHINELTPNYKIITSFKSLLGTDNEVIVADRRYDGVMLATIFLTFIKNSVKRSDFTEAVFSIPVDFTSKSRHDLLKAAENAGIKVKAFISESTSAYIFKQQSIKQYSKVMVIDWGGGTLDLSILNLKGNTITEEAVYGIKYGGDDIDEELARRLQPKAYPDYSFDELPSDKKDILLKNTEDMKKQFSPLIAENEATVVDANDYASEYRILCGPGSKPLIVEHSDYVEMTAPLLNLSESEIVDELCKIICPMVFTDTSYFELVSIKKDRLKSNIEKMMTEFQPLKSLKTVNNDYHLTKNLLLGKDAKPVRVEYDDFVEIVSPLVYKYVLPAINHIMKMVNVKPAGIDAVILAGGSSGLAPFTEVINNVFPDKVIFDNDYQWMVAKGAAITNALDCQFILCDDICLLLSDNSKYPILKSNINKVGDTVDSISFSLTEDSEDAHFIFVDSEGNKYSVLNVYAKGFLDEKLTLSASIDRDQIARIKVSNSNISSDYCVTTEINKLKFYYDLSKISLV
ncbi:MAG: Hsp70 family protein [Oscillospiraceae bacterium]|nr:Hsp70 family protein [Oscillospiraceae bacterium]